MKNQMPASFLKRKSLPVVVAATLGLAACSGEQAGDTNGGMVGAGGISGTSALGVAGGVVLAGLLLASDDSDAAGNPVVTPPGGNVPPVNQPPVNEPPGDDEVVPPGDEGDLPPGGVVLPPAGNPGGLPPGGAPSGGTDTAGGGFLTNTGVFQEQLVGAEAVPASTATGVGVSDLLINRSTGNTSGTVMLNGFTADRVDLMVGPPGSNGFVAIEMESRGNGLWEIPATLSDDQRAFVLQNINSGNLYVGARDEQPAGSGMYVDVVRTQLLPAEVMQYSTSVSGTEGGIANGYLLVNPDTGDYSITWNTSDVTLTEAHVNDGIVSGATENTWATITQRNSNKARFFRDGNFTDASDPLYPDLLDRLGNGTVWLDAHRGVDRIFHGQLTATN